tara:strand:- start:213 stop:371 length:159 start_codon:yes stop_codon:yes gene_type:complete
MALLQLLILYFIGGTAVNIYAEIIMKGDPEWTVNNRILLFISWPLYLYALTL